MCPDVLSRCSATGLVEGWRDRGEWGVSRLAHLWGGVGDGAPIPACVSTRAGGTVYIIFFVQVSVALRCVCVCAGVCVCSHCEGSVGLTVKPRD